MLCLAGLMFPLVAVLQGRQRVAAAADAAALAASSVSMGILPGIPCEQASRVAVANGASVSGCEVDGEVVTVRAADRILGFEIAVSATAGPPGVGVG